MLNYSWIPKGSVKGAVVKIYNSLKFRFVALFTLFIIILCTVMTFYSVKDTTDTVLRVYAEQGVFIVKKAADAIDGDAFERLAKTLDDQDPFYVETQRELFAIKSDTSCTYLYTMAPVQGNIYRFIIDGSVTPDDVENFSALGEEEDTSNYDSSFKQCWVQKKTLYSGLQDQGEWGWLISIYTPVFNSQGVMVGIVGCDYDAEKLHSELLSYTIRQIIIIVIFVALGLGIMFYFLRLIFSRLTTINLILKEISEGEGDLTRRIKILRRDEIGELAEHFNNTLEKIKRLVVAIKDQTASLFGIGSELAENMRETSAAIKNITSNIQDIKGQVINQSASVSETNATMGQVTGNIDRLNTHVEMQTASVSQSSSAIEEMLANIQSVTRTLIRNAENVNGLTAASEVGRTGLEEVSGDIHEIARESEGLLEINAVMNNIASQTNLLSMNAAIEAAHAGEAGRGFAVVADEIRKLAENSGKQSRIISDVLKKIKNSIDKIIKSNDTVLEKFQAIDSGIKTVSDQEQNIRNAMEEQGHGSQQILEAIGKLNELTRYVRDGSGQMLEGSQEVIHESKNLELLTQKLSGEINEMAEDTEQINAAVNRVDEATGINKKHIDALVSEVSKFRVE